MPTSSRRDLSFVLLKPRITEKAAVVGSDNVQVFEVHPSATKKDVRDAVKMVFNVTPRKVNIVNQKSRAVVSRMRGNRKGKRAGLRKAYVYLKEGDRISLV